MRISISSYRSRQHGASLVVVMMIIIVASILGVSGIQVAMMGERSTRNQRDFQVAWQSAEAALIDAEFDIEGLPASFASKRNQIFRIGAVEIDKFISGCGNSGQSIGLCALNTSGKPAWLTVNFLTTGNSAPTTEFGQFTGRTFPSGTAGIQPARQPRYAIEAIPDPNISRTRPPSEMRYVYRITAMGFGPNDDTQAVIQIIYRN